MFRASLVGLIIVLLTIIVACGEEATPTEEPDTTPATTEAAVAPAPAQSPGTAPAPAAAAPTQAVAATVATPTAAPVPAAAQSPTAMVEATGSLDFAIPELAPLISDLAAMPYGVFRFLNKTTHETMWDTNNDGTLRPRLVREWELEEGPNSATYTFHLQQGAKWHDTYGNYGEFDADDFIFSIERISTAGTPHAASSGIRKVFGCEGCSMEKVDQYTMQLTRPQPTFEVFWHNSNPIDAIMSFHSKEQFEAEGEENVVLKDVGTGPWRIDPDRFLSGQTYTMESIQGHWFRSPEWETMTWTGIAEPSTREANFLTGKLDTATFDLEQIVSIRNQDRDDIKYMTFTGQKAMRIPIAGLQYNLDHSSHQGEEATVPVKLDAIKCNVPFISCSGDTSSAEWAQARNVRLAMTIAIDRNKMLNALAFGEGVARYADFFASHDGRAKQFGLDELFWEYDVARAKQLLADAGYPNGFEVEAVLSLRGIPQMEAACAMWESINVACKIRNEPWSSYRPKHVSRSVDPGPFSNFIPPVIEPLWIMNLFHSSNNSLNLGFEHPEFQAMLDEARDTNDADARFQLQADITKWMFEHVMTIPLYDENSVFPLGPEIDEWEQQAGGLTWLSNWEFVPHRKN